jgi:thiamine transport system permease protein
MSAALLVFLYSFTSFAVVLVLGGGPAATTLAVEIYRHARIFLNYPNAGALAFIETLIAVSVFLSYAYFGKKSRDIKTDLQKRIIDERKISLPVLIIMIVYGVIAAIFILGPIVSIIFESLLYRSSRSASQVLSAKWWLSLGDTALPALLRSLVLAFSSATVACVLAVFGAGYLKLQENSGKGNSIRANILRFLAAAPIISSGIVLGLGWLIIYGNNFSRSPLALVILHAVIALPFAFKSISEGFRSLPANTINAAMVFGADPLKALLTAAIPLSLKRIRSGWGFAAALSLGELNAVMMLGMEKWETLPLFIYRAVGAYRYGIACAAGTLLSLCCAACFLLAEGSLKNTGKKYGT